jgi:ATP-dependent RNA helicase DHX57
MQSIALHPEDEEESAMAISPNIVPEVSQQLELLGFTKNQIRDATNFLLTSSPLASSLLQSSSPLQACIEYLVLHLPECDLPTRFLPSKNSSNPFVTSGHSGEQNIKSRWMEDKAVKEAGWPPQVVKDVLTTADLPQRWDLVLVALGAKLIGRAFDLASSADSSTYPIDPDEYEALGAELEDAGHLALPLFSAPIKVHILYSDTERYPRPGYLPIFITSSTAPAYVRLHLLSCLLLAMEETPTLDSGEGFCMTVMRILEDEWARIESEGPPDISQVLKNLVPPVNRFAQSTNMADDELALARRGTKRSHHARREKRGDSTQIKQAFENLQQTDKVRVHFLDREEHVLIVRIVQANTKSERKATSLQSQRRLFAEAGEKSRGCRRG